MTYSHEIYRQFREDLSGADSTQLGKLTDMLHGDRAFAREAGPEFVLAADAAHLQQEAA